MKTSFRALRLFQLDAALKKWRDADLPEMPATGWAQAIREALGMSGRALGERLGMTSGGVRKLETAEAEQVITLASLRKLGEALGCELRYALVPRQPLEQKLADQARVIARQKLGPVSHSMSLEDQTIGYQAEQAQLATLVKDLLDGPRGKLW